jgi:Domain of unknown function (DUF4157)
MSEKRAKTGLVLQGYFCIERFRGAGRVAAAQARAALPPRPRAPRPELLPTKMRGKTGQRKPEPGPESPWRRAPRPELLPGMGPSRLGGPRRAVQAQSSQRVSTTPIPAGQLRVIGEGRPLDAGIRQTMERFFEADFSSVRVHEGPAAQAMGALAFTLGEELHFAPGLYDPTTREGMELLGHELTHVVQQRGGRVTNPYGQGVAIVQDPALEAEADEMGRKLADEIWGHGRRLRPAKLAVVMRKPATLAKLELMRPRVRPSRIPKRLVQRAIAYVEDRNEGDIAEGQKYYRAIKRGVTPLQEAGPAGYALSSVTLATLPEAVQRQITDVRAREAEDPWNLYELGFRDFHANRGGHLPENDPGQQERQAGRLLRLRQR